MIEMDSSSLYPFIYNVSVLYFPPKIIFGPKVIDRIGDEILQFRGSNVLVVTDETMVKIGNVDRIKDILKKKGVKVEVYDEVEPDPHVEIANDVAKLARKREFDIVVGLGGGSSMDTAKVASIAKQNKGSVSRYVGADKVREKGLPLLLVPTTSGTGSEVTPYAIFTVGEKKGAIVSHYIVPDIALVDPLLTISMPPKVTAGSGLDALSHAIESMISLWSTPLTDGLALEAIRLISKYLRAAYNQSKNFKARCYMALAATTAGLSFSSPRVVYGHSVAQTFAPLYQVAHGTSCAIALPYIMDFYLPVSTSKLANIARAMGEPVEDKSTREAAVMAVQAVYQLTQDLNIPRLRDLGVTQDQLPSLAEACISDWPRPNSPRQFTKEAALAVFENMWECKFSTY
jgi:alcohol dehydrogenase class IV